MLHYPNINPIAFHLGPLKVHWYGIMYLIGFGIGYLLACYRAKKTNSGWQTEEIADLLFYIALGVILGGRLGYVIFYNFHYYLEHPGQTIALWDGGMSFHGGLIGVIAACWLWQRKHRKGLFVVTDFIAPIVPIGLGAGRLGNFINGELWGRVTTMPWGMVYPHAGPLPRHPSELYELFFEGILLFTLLWFYSRKPRPRMATSGLFLLLYGAFRFFCEFFRQPDPQIGFVAWGWLTRGQELSIPMILLGAILLGLAWRQSASPWVRKK
jgi:phosphatidylglycerol:prolipoprotein diacylglycerol transferase